MAGPLVVCALLVALPAHFGWGTPRVSRPTRLLSRVIPISVVVAQMPLAASYTLGIVLSARRPFTWRQAADWVAERTAPGDRVASFNSGSFGYLAPRVVVNLDGVANNPGIRALEEHRLIGFLREWKIRYILDDLDYVAKYMRAFSGGEWKQVLAPVDTLRAPVVVYEVRVAARAAPASESLSSRRSTSSRAQPAQASAPPRTSRQSTSHRRPSATRSRTALFRASTLHCP